MLHRFRGGSDGADPKEPLLALGGSLYGTTNVGGAAGCDHYCGTLYHITTSGVETVLYRFHGGSDGSNPTGRLTVVDGALYGTTAGGGGSHCKGSQCGFGTVFTATTAGVESVVYAFKGPPDAADANRDLVADHGILYGTSDSGGNVCGQYDDDAGTIFAVTSRGSERIAYAFPCKSKPRSGRNPTPGLLRFGRAFYGTTFDRYGTVYAFTP